MPLILPSQRVIRPNPLAYPAGAVPGINLEHPASKGLVLSSVAGPGNNYVNVLTGAPLTNQQGSQTAVPSASVDGAVGPAVTSLISGKSLGVAFSGNISGLTAAGIFRYSASSVAGYQCVSTYNSGIGLFILANAVDFYLNGDTLGPTLSFNTPYFVAASAKLAGAGSPWLIVVKNLITGQVSTASGTHTQAGFANTAICVGNDTSNEFSNFPIAATMFGDTFLSLPQLLAWAKDPWSFWYPNKTINLASAAASAGASFLPVWAYRYNLPVLGTGNF